MEAHSLSSKTPFIIVLVAMILIVLDFISLPLKMQNYNMFAGGLIALASASICLMVHSKIR